MQHQADVRAVQVLLFLLLSRYVCRHASARSKTEDGRQAATVNGKSRKSEDLAGAIHVMERDELVPEVLTDQV